MRFGLGLCFSLLLARPAALDSYDVVLYGGDRSPALDQTPIENPSSTGSPI